MATRDEVQQKVLDQINGLTRFLAGDETTIRNTIDVAPAIRDLALAYRALNGDDVPDEDYDVADSIG